MVALEIEPTDARYVAFLKPTETIWYLEEYIAIGKTIAEADDAARDKIKKEALAQGASPRFQGWQSSSERWELPSKSIDMALLADGAIIRLGSALEAALSEVKRVLRSGGRLFIIANDDDEQALGGRFEDMLEGSIVDKAGFELVAAKRGDCGVTVSYLRKKRKKGTGKKMGKFLKVKRAY